MPVLRKAVFISLLGHLTLFGLFNVSFGKRMPAAEFTSVSFWGQYLRASQLIPPIALSRPSRIAAKPDTSILDKKGQDSLSLTYHVKPAIAMPLNSEKEAYIEEPVAFPFSIRKSEPTVILHPLLPYSFMLYFRDRQSTHVELLFNISSSAEKKSINLKRKISSGNLEVDLLALRYISHYLFVQQANFTPNKWQSVKIDLSQQE